MSLDESDRRILRLLQEDAQLTIARLAERTGLSASAVQRRLQRLRDEKVILRDVSIVDPRKTGVNVTLLVELELERDRPELLAELHAWIARTPQIQQAWNMTGRGDYTLVVLAGSVDEFDALAEAMLVANRNIRKFTTSVVLKHVKSTLAVPV